MCGSMIGKVCGFVMPFFNTASGVNDFKMRPVLVVGIADKDDLNVLPISKVTKRAFLSPKYDYELVPATYPLLNLTDVSYVRIHKQTVVHTASVVKQYGDMKLHYPDLFLEILTLLDAYNQMLVSDAL